MGRGVKNADIRRITRRNGLAVRPKCPISVDSEDDELVRNFFRTVLEEKGYKVIPATNGAEGLRICEDLREPIDLMITDVVMPEMGGRQLAESIASLRPETKVLFMSGYTDDAIVRHGILEEKTAFIQKPFLPDSLALKAREVLDARQG